MPTAFEDIQTAFYALEQVASWQVVGVLVAAGALSMAILDAIKNFSPIRRWFHSRWIRRWIEVRTATFNTSGLLPQIDPGKTIIQLIDLSTGGEEHALFNLPSEQLIAQINAAAQAALDYPQRYAEVLASLSQGADREDVQQLLDVGSGTGDVDQRVLDARNRVGNRIQRNLDGAQIALKDRWQLIMQLVAMFIAILLLELAVLFSSSGDIAAAVLAIPIGIAGGYLAPVLRDLVVALQQLRA